MENDRRVLGFILGYFPNKDCFRKLTNWAGLSKMEVLRFFERERKESSNFLGFAIWPPGISNSTKQPFKLFKITNWSLNFWNLFL